MAAKKNKFSEFTPQGIGATPAQPQIPPPEPAPAAARAVTSLSAVEAPAARIAPSEKVQELLREKVPESLRVPIAARDQVRQLREKTRLSKDAVYLEALNMLFRKHGMSQI